ncbi:MAG: glycine cleavage system aminomethyltransferase GcvT [Bacteroidetes bacterium]|jgi:aminomethyltransferase|nr:glycine cleavage system aminomethyltransferase GcvT [Bacteroidota bacterium]
MADTPDALLHTPLHDRHVALDARMTNFGGFAMPVQYTGIIDEHMAVRERAGLFDVSHMGEVMVRGPQAFNFIQQLITNDLAKLYDGRALYTVMCNDAGGVVDDLLVYRLHAEAYMLVINAANRTVDVDWMRAHNPMGATIDDRSDALALLAVQGPEAIGLVQSLTDEPVADLKFYHFLEARDGGFQGVDWALLSRTGYTGEPGLEIYCYAADAPALWETLLEAGDAVGLKPAGLGARDTLRLEAGLCLYGNDLDAETNPLAAGLGWLVAFGKGPFIGKEALQEIKAQGPKEKLIGFVMDERGIPRSGYTLHAPADEDAPIGRVTSGSQSPVLAQGIGLGYVRNEAVFTAPGRALHVSMRGRLRAATVVKPPFHT